MHVLIFIICDRNILLQPSVSHHPGGTWWRFWDRRVHRDSSTDAEKSQGAEKNGRSMPRHWICPIQSKKPIIINLFIEINYFSPVEWISTSAETSASIIFLGKCLKSQSKSICKPEGGDCKVQFAARHLLYCALHVWAARRGWIFTEGLLWIDQLSWVLNNAN